MSIAKGAIDLGAIDAVLLIQQARHLEFQQLIDVLIVESVRLRIGHELFIEMEDCGPAQFLSGGLRKLLF